MKKFIALILISSLVLSLLYTENEKTVLASGSQSLTFQVGTIQTLYCGLYYNDGYNKSWVSSNSSVAAVISNKGAYCDIELKSIGSCTIYFSVRYKKYEVVNYQYGYPIFGYREYSDDFTYYINVTKGGEYVPSFISIGDTVNLKPGKSLIFDPSVKDTNGHYNYNYNKIIWSSSNKNVATVNQIGVVTGWANGTAIITATTPEGIKDTCTASVSSPYGFTAISSASQLSNIRNNPSGNYILTNNIVFSDSDFSQSGAFYNTDHAWNPIEGFTGILDGNGFYIQNLHVKLSNGGLFNNFKGTIRDLEIKDGLFTGSGCVGAFFGTGESCKLINCKSTNNTITGSEAGGFAGNIRQYGYFFNCVNTSVVKATSSAGGFAGYGAYLRIFLGTNKGIVGSSTGIAGGFIGDGGGFNSVKYCSNESAISGNTYTGGIVGDTGYYSRIDSTINTGKITGNANNACVGGIMGKGYTTFVEDCVNSGAVELISGSLGFMGGITGISSDLSYSPGENTLMLSNSFSNGVMKYTGTALPRIGGISGAITGKAQMAYQSVGRNCFYLTNTAQVAIPYIQYGLTSGLLPLTTEQMKSIANFNGFDFNYIWILKPGASYPSLRFRDAISGMGIIGVPNSFSCVSNGYNSIKLSWSAGTNAAGYEIYRASSLSGAYSIISSQTASLATNYINNALATGTTYYYKIRSYNTIGNTKSFSSFSSIISSKPVLLAPGSLASSSPSYNSIKLSWAAVTGANGYSVYRSTSATGTFTLLSTVTTNYYTNVSLTTGTTYYYKIAAYRLVGTTKVYGPQCAAVGKRVVPATITTFTAVRYSATSIKLTLGGVSGASGYEIYRSTAVSGTYTLLKAQTALTYTNTALKTGTTYYYKVRSYRLVGTTKVYSDFSSIKSAKP